MVSDFDSFFDSFAEAANYNADNSVFWAEFAEQKEAVKRYKAELQSNSPLLTQERRFRLTEHVTKFEKWASEIDASNKGFYDRLTAIRYYQT